VDPKELSENERATADQNDASAEEADERDWVRASSLYFFEGYDESDAIYDQFAQSQGEADEVTDEPAR
jgi:hypothetical protein